MHRIFLISPASTKGARGAALFAPGARSPLAKRLRDPDGVPLVEVFTYLSSLYFRGKATYADRFATPPEGLPGALVITPGAGLRPTSHRVTATELQRMAQVEVSEKRAAYVDILVRDAADLLKTTRDTTEFVLLGSLATAKYVQPLLSVFGYLLFFPREFVGKGDMSRGGLLLRAVRDGRELDYARVATCL